MLDGFSDLWKVGFLWWGSFVVDAQGIGRTFNMAISRSGVCLRLDRIRGCCRPREGALA